MKAQLVTILLLLVLPCCGQQLHILRPDSSVFASASQYDYVAIRTLSRDYVAGQLTLITPDTLVLIDRKQTKHIAISQVIGLKKTSKFGITAKRLSVYSAVVPILFLPAANSNVYEGRTWANQFLTRAAVIIPVGVGLGLLMNGRPLRQTAKGYSFKVVQ